jgi:ABC-type multidrug transport system fused ATPase/permease subunit
MKSFELIITILFVLVIRMVVVKDMPLHLVVPFLALWFVVLFIGFDNMGVIPAFDSSNGIRGLLPIFSKKRCKNDTAEDKVEETCKDIKVTRSTIKTEVETPKEFKDAPTPEFKQTYPEPLMYDEYKYRENLFPDASCSGDYLLAEKMKHMGLQPKVSIDAQSRVDKYTNYGYLAEELDSHANSIWWDDETLEDEF